jgi:NADH:ubiquinone oxidoreductase subunit 6 (subunit J)
MDFHDIFDKLDRVINLFFTSIKLILLIIITLTLYQTGIKNNFDYPNIIENIIILIKQKFVYLFGLNSFVFLRTIINNIYINSKEFMINYLKSENLL